MISQYDVQLVLVFLSSHTYPETWKKYCDDTRLRFCVGIDLCHILVGKNQKKQIFPSANTELSQFQNMASIKTNKIKKRMHFIISTFENLQLCFFVQKDSATLKVLKMQFVFGWAYDKGHCIFNLQCSLLWLSQRQIAFLGPLEWRNLFGQKSKVVSFQKLILWSGVHFLILFVLMDAIFWNCDISVLAEGNFWFLVFPNQYMAKINSHTKSQMGIVVILFSCFRVGVFRWKHSV